MVKKGPQFKVVKILDQGTSNPIVNRITHQFFDILQRGFIELPKPRIEKIETILFECMKDLLKAEESKDAFLMLENQVIEKILSRKGVLFQPHAFSYEDPTESLKKHFEDFLIRNVIAIRKVIKIAEIVFSKTFKGPENLKKYLKSLFSETSPEMKMIEEDSVWMKELYDLRGDAEHDELEIEPFNIEILEEGQVSFKIMRLEKKGLTIREYMNVTLENCFIFCEDMTVMLLNTKYSEMVQIVLIPENLRPKYQDFKYTLDLKGKYKERFLETINKEKRTPTDIGKRGET